MENIVAALQAGDDALVRVLLRDHINTLNTSALVCSIAQYGTLTSVIYVLDVVTWTRYNVWLMIQGLAVYENMKALDALCKLYVRECGSFKHGRLFSMGRNLKSRMSLECLYKHGWRPTKCDVQGAIFDGNIVFARWCFERGYTHHDSAWLTHTKITFTNEILELLHDYKVNGTYKRKCKKGTCAICKKQIIEDMWIMMSEIFDNTTQWLPREMLDDTFELV
jgi:hypothetical protein